jgi:hypothetical protein
MRMGFLVAGLLLASLCGSAAADPEFHLYESRAPLIKDGQGGERKTVDGVDIWLHGDPPRRYQIIGSLTDVRKKNPILAQRMFGHEPRMADLEGDIAKAAKASGGDAAILEDEKDAVTRYMGGGDEGSIRPLMDHQSRYAVVKYLPDAPGMPAAR